MVTLSDLCSLPSELTTQDPPSSLVALMAGPRRWANARSFSALVFSRAINCTPMGEVLYDGRSSSGLIHPCSHGVSINGGSASARPELWNLILHTVRGLTMLCSRREFQTSRMRIVTIAINDCDKGLGWQGLEGESLLIFMFLFCVTKGPESVFSVPLACMNALARSPRHAFCPAKSYFTTR